MILYRKEPYPLQMRNVMLLDDVKSGGVLYVNKLTYDQAIMLSSRLDGDPKRVLQILTSPKTEAYKATFGLKGLVDEMIASMPKPLNMLAPFLIFCVQNQGIEWKADDREFAYGILHQFSQLIDFNAMTLIPVEVRNNVTVPTAILTSYQASWDDLCSTLKDNVVMSYAPVQQVVAPVVQQTVTATAPIPAQPAQPAQSVTPATAPVQNAAPTPSQPAEESEEERMAKAIEENKRMLEEADRKAAERRKKMAKITAGTPEVKKPATSPAASATTEVSESNAILDEFDV